MLDHLPVANSTQMQESVDRLAGAITTKALCNTSTPSGAPSGLDATAIPLNTTLGNLRPGGHRSD